MASSLSCAATPMNCTSGFCCDTRATAPASRRHVGHQGAQNQSTVSVPCTEFRSSWPPPTRSTKSPTGAAVVVATVVVATAVVVGVVVVAGASEAAIAVEPGAAVVDGGSREVVVEFADVEDTVSSLTNSSGPAASLSVDEPHAPATRRNATRRAHSRRGPMEETVWRTARLTQPLRARFAPCKKLVRHNVTTRTNEVARRLER